jgi:hypothetical protein
MRIKFPETPRSIVIEAALSDQEFDDLCADNPHAEVKRTENGVIILPKLKSEPTFIDPL